MIFAALAFGFCAYTDGAWAYVGREQFVDGVRMCDVVMGAEGDGCGGTNVDGHDIQICPMGNDQALISIDGRRMMIGPQT